MNSNPLKITSPDLHRFWFKIANTKQWYGIMRECRAWFGKNWKCEGKVKRKLDYQLRFHHNPPLSVWFDVPDNRFATWISVKYSIEVESDFKKKAGK